MKPVPHFWQMLALFACFGISLGCSNQKTPLLPQGPLTAEQQEKVRQEDALTEEEESGRNNPARQLPPG